MPIWVSFLLFAFGVLLVVKGGDFFVDAASWIARATGIPSFIVGATIVSIATTLPEMIVSLIAAAGGKTDMAIGNAVGSVTANTGLILACALIFLPVICPRKSFWKQLALLISACAVLFVSCLGGELNIIGSIILIVIFILFMTYSIISAKNSPSDEEKPTVTRRDVAVNAVKFIVGAAAIVGGSQLLVNSGSDIATFFGVPSRVIAVTLVAVGTSLPELVTTITAIVKKQAHMSIGNIVGANIIDTTLILPLCSLVSGKALPVSETSMMIDIPVCLAVTLFAAVPLLIRQKGARWQGTVLALGYIAYLVVVL